MKKTYILTDGGEIFLSRDMTDLEFEAAQVVAIAETDGNVQWQPVPDKALLTVSEYRSAFGDTVLLCTPCGAQLKEEMNGQIKNTGERPGEVCDWCGAS